MQFKARIRISVELQFESLPRRSGGPLAEKRGAEGPNILNLSVGKHSWNKCVEFFRAPHRAGRSLGIEQADDLLHFNRLGWKRAVRAFVGGVLHVPAFGDQAEKAASIAKDGFHREVRQIVQREMRSVLRLLLPRDGTIGPRAAQHSCAIWLFGDLDRNIDLRIA
jgi:hypothetical protein